MEILSIVLLCILGFIVLLCILCTINVGIALSSPLIGQNNIESTAGVQHPKEQALMMKQKALEATKIEFEEIEVKSFDGLVLFGKFYQGDIDKPYIILMHGYRGVAERDFGYVLPMMINHRYNVLLIDERSCRKSQGRCVTFGINERKDARTWTYYLLNRFGRDINICLFGISMGAASVLMATELNLPHEVRCIVADCPYSEPKEIIMKTCLDFKLPPSISFALLKIGAYIYKKIDLEAASPIEAVKHTNIPIELLHGEKDLFVPCEMSKKIEDQCYGYVERHTFKEAGHAYASLVEPERYEMLVTSFIDKYTKS